MSTEPAPVATDDAFSKDVFPAEDALDTRSALSCGAVLLAEAFRSVAFPAAEALEVVAATTTADAVAGGGTTGATTLALPWLESKLPHGIGAT